MKPATAKLSRGFSTATFANQTPTVELESLFKLTYGLFLLTAKDEKDNGCIVNTVVQTANEPTRISVSVQKDNLTREMIEKTGKFNVSVLTERVPYEVIARFGAKSGREVDKFDGFSSVERTKNGILYLSEYTNAYFSAKVVSTLDLGSHVQFIGELTEGKTLGNDPSCTYAYYHQSIKPQ